MQVFGFSGVSCISCRATCDIGEYINSTCSDPLARHDQTNCLECSTCGPGSYSPVQCAGNSREDVTECTPCRSKCEAGQFISGVCDSSSKVDTISCLNCQSGCEAGYYTDGSCSGMGVSDEVECVACPENTFLVLSPIFSPVSFSLTSPGICFSLVMHVLLSCHVLCF